MPEAPASFALYDDDDQARLRAAIGAAYTSVGATSRYVRSAAQMNSGFAEEEKDTGGVEPSEHISIPPMEDLYGVDPSVYRQIETALNSDKRHLMFYGPPGTGKTTLARRVAAVLNGRNWTLITGSADWSSQDIIGGYQPMSDGSIQFFPGVLLRDFDRPLVIDELNRCDIDKVLGPLFTVLSGQATTLPYRVDASSALSPQYVLLPTHKADKAAHEFSPSPGWRLIATINSIDKASLYQMSYALSRRFGWIYVDAPADPAQFVREYVEKALLKPVSGSASPPLAVIWSAINNVRVLGAAPVIDCLRAIYVEHPDADVFTVPEGELLTAHLDSFDLFLLPLLDGILRHEAEQIAEASAAALGLPLDSSQAGALKRRLLSVAV